MKRCAGQCCRGFNLSGHTHASYEAIKRNDPDGRMIAAMVIPEGTGNHGEPAFNCKHQAENGDCTVYAFRPKMCVDFPYNRACRVPGCQADCYGMGAFYAHHVVAYRYEESIQRHAEYYFTW